MTNIGTLEVKLVLTDLLSSQLKSATANLNKTMSNFSKKGFGLNTSEVDRNFGVFWKRIDAGILGAQEGFSSFTKDTNKGLDSVTKATSGFVDSLKNMKKGAIGQLLDIKTMIGQIVHYITFSIGVQLVMMIKKGIGESIESFKSFERAAANAATVSGYLGASFKTVMQRMMQMSIVLSKETVYSAKEIQEAFYQIASAGIDVGKVTKGQLIPILNYAAATQSDLAKATEDVLTTMYAFGLSMEDTGRIVDVFTEAITSSYFTMQKMSDFMKFVAPIAGALGIALEETVAAGMLLVNMGMEGGQAGERLNMIFTRLLEPTDKAEEILAGLGLTINDLNPEVWSLTEILFKLRAAGFGAAEAAGMFRARTASSAAVLVEGAYDIERYNQQLLMSKGITESVAAAQESTFYGSMKLMTNAVEELYIAIGESLAPMLTAFANNIKKIVPEVVKFVKGFVSAIPTLMRLVQILIVYKTITMALGGAIFLLNAVTAIRSILLGQQIGLEGGLIGKLILGAKALWAKKTATDAENASLATNVTLTALATGGLSILAGIAVLAATGVMTMTNAMVDLTSTTEETSLALKQFAGEGFRDVLASVDPWEAAMWNAANSNRTFLSSLSEVENEYKKFGLEISKETYIDKLYDTMEEKGAFKGFGGELESAAKYEIETYFKALDEHWVKEESRFKAENAEWWEILLVIPAAFKGIKNLFGAITQGMSDLGYESAREFFAGFANVDISEIVDSESLFKALGITADEMIKNLVITKSMSAEIAFYNTNLQILSGSLNEISVAEAELNEVKARSGATTQELIDAEEKYNNAINKKSTAISNMMTSIKSIVTQIRSMDERLDLGVQILEDSIKATNELENAQRELDEAMINEKDASLELSEAIAIYGSNSKEAANSERALANAIRDRVEAEQEVGELGEANLIMEARVKNIEKYGVVAEKTQKQLIGLGYSTEDTYKMIENFSLEDQLAFLGKEVVDEKTLSGYTKLGDILKDNAQFASYGQTELLKDTDSQKALSVIMELSQTQKDLINITLNLTTAREQLADATTKQAMLEAKLASFTAIQENFTTYLTEKTKSYLDVLMKIFDIKLKLYKIDEDQQKQYEDLFDKLAEQGMLDQETIDLYKEMEKAKGEQLKLNKPFMDVYGELSDSERGLVTDYINGKITLEKLTDELLKNGNVTEEQIGIIANYKKASDDLAGSIKAIGDKTQPLVNDLMEIGAVSSDTAEAYSKLADNGLEVAQSNVELMLQYGKIDAEITSLIGNTTRLAKSLLDVEGETLADEFDNLVEKMGLTGDIIDETGGSIDILNAFFGDKRSIDEYSEAELNVATTMIQMLQTMQLWEDGMDGNAAATLLGSDSLQTWINKATIAWSTEESMLDITNQLTLAINEFNIAMDSFKDLMVDFYTMTGGKSALALAFEWDMEDALTQYDGLKKFLGELEKEGINVAKVGADIQNHWDIGDWSAIASEFEDLPDLYADLKNLGINVPITYDGKSWKDWYAALTGEQQQEFINAISSYSDAVGLGLKWDFDFQNFLGGLSTEVDSEGKSMKDKFLDQVSQMSGQEVDTILTWNTMDWANFLTDMNSKGVNIYDTLQGYFDANHIKIWIDYVEGEKPKLTFGQQFFNAFKENGTAGVKSFLSELVANLKEKLLDRKEGRKGMLTNGPVNALIGEAGPEAVIPLAGKNKKYGKDILENIIPKYFPDLKFMQEGGVAGTVSTDTSIRQGGKQINIQVTTDATSFNQATLNFINGTTTFVNQLTTILDKDIEKFGKEIRGAGNSFEDSVSTVVNTILYKAIIDLALVLATPIEVNVSVDTGNGQQKGGIYNKATMGVFGEKGAEALIPLEGGNRKYGEQLLRKIIPSYYPDLMFQGGGLFTRGGGFSDNSENYEENYNVLGPVYVNANNAEDMGKSLKYKYRMSK